MIRKRGGDASMKPKYLNPLIDYIFKKIFGDEKHKEILISFLNSLEIESQGRKIVDLQILNNANEKRFKRDKFSILDIKAKLDNGDLVNIEVQILPYDNMLQRTMYYWAKLYSDQLNQGEDYGALNNTVVVNVLGYNQFPHKKIHSVYQIRDKESGEKLGDFLEIHFLETRKIEESQQEINEDLKGWLLFLSDPENQRLMKLGKEKEEMGKAINLLEELSRSREERAIAEEREKALRDELSFRK
ncbi:MAG TPA: Rpn family recombination-promoting nuclease/putative transposase, partial [Thermotogota bacterium]|nr:Rpn family recombination-promoting nuclease/putative transposase [Thermotogota bacterium]